jgi:glutamine synthetase
MTVLNLILADQLQSFKKDVDKLLSKKITPDNAIFQVLKKYVTESKKIRFEGNNYSNEWVQEAARRGLSNIGTTPLALKTLVNRKTIQLFERNNVLTARELEARHEIYLDDYTKKLQIESRVLGDLITNHIIPCSVKYLNTLSECVINLKAVLDHKAFSKVTVTEVATIAEIAENIHQVKTLTCKMIDARKSANKIKDPEEKAMVYCEKVFPFLERIRYYTNKLEFLVDDSAWPLPKYRELLFTQ